MNVLVACEYSGRVRDAFIKAGHKAWSCDLLPSESDLGPHYHMPIEEVIDDKGCLPDGTKIDLLIAHPPCTYLAVSGLHWNKRNPERAKKTQEALAFIEWLWSLPIRYKCIENPVGCINTHLSFMPRPQYVQPYEFGEDASKKTGLWLDGLPPLKPTSYVEPRFVDGKPRWANQTDSGQNRLGPSDDRWKLRSYTYQGLAEAMASQWSNITKGGA